MKLLKKLCKTLKKHNIRHAIVGGYAVALHGAARGTIDIDFILPFEEQVFIDTEKILLSLGFQPRLPITAKEVFNFREEYIKNRNLIAWSFVNRLNPFEIIDIILTQDLNSCVITEKKLADTIIPILSKKDLIKMKKKSGRKQDLLDIKALENLE